MSKIITLVVAILFLPGIELFAQKNILNGQVVDTVTCEAYPNQSYALYLPSNYDPTKSWPIIYIFEPGARGKLPVGLFKYAAEKYGYIIVGSNNSRNGSWDIAKDAAVAMIEDTQLKFSINDSRMYTSGFSGGSRAATAIAVLARNFTGIIACGAGFSALPQYQPKAGMKFDYVALVGDKDMNYLEHHAVRNTLNNININNHLILFNGRHQWPDSLLLYQAVEWLELQGMKKKIIPLNSSWIAANYRQRFSIINNLPQTQIFEKHRQYVQLYNDFQNVLPVAFLTDTIQNIESSKLYGKEKKKRARINKEEAQEREKYLQALTSLNYGAFQNSELAFNEEWWDLEIRHLQKITRSGDEIKSNMANRLLNMIWANCAETSFSLVNQKNYSSALDFTKLWVKIQPESTWALWYIAKIYALKGDNQEAFDYLEKAHQFGLNNFNVIKNDPAFKSLEHDKRYQKLESKIKSTAQVNR